LTIDQTAFEEIGSIAWPRLATQFGRVRRSLRLSAAWGDRFHPAIGGESVHTVPMQPKQTYRQLAKVVAIGTNREPPCAPQRIGRLAL
jgi:hypothetical protein